MPRIPIGLAHLFSTILFLSQFFFVFFFFTIVGAHWPSLFRCPNTNKVKVSQGKMNSRIRDQKLGVHKKSNVCVCARVPKGSDTLQDKGDLHTKPSMTT